MQKTDRRTPLSAEYFSGDLPKGGCRMAGASDGMKSPLVTSS